MIHHNEQPVLAPRESNVAVRRSANERGFTLIELMIVVVIVGILASIGIANMQSMVKRAKEGNTKANMHVVQVMAEDYGVQNNGVYASDMDASHIVDLLPTTFKNPFSGGVGENDAWENRASFGGPAAAVPGISSYADSATTSYNVKGHGSDDVLGMVLTSGI